MNSLLEYGELLNFIITFQFDTVLRISGSFVMGNGLNYKFDIIIFHSISK